MEEKSIKIYFEPKRYLATLNAIWDYRTTKTFRIYVVCTVISMLFLLTGIVFSLRGNNSGLLILGAISVIITLANWIKFYNNKAEYFRKGLGKSIGYKSTDYSVYSFYEKDFEYKDEEKLYRLNWQLFKPYVVFKDIIILTLKENEEVYGAINRQAISNEDFDEIREILNEKTGFREI